MQLIILLAGIIIASNAQFNGTTQAAIVNAHNDLRSQIAKGTYVVRGVTKPQGTNILKMKWDDSIAASAQAYAEKCLSFHSQTPGLGENIYSYQTTDSVGDLNQYGVMATDAWENEFQISGWTSNLFDINLFNSGVGHATQVVWANTGLIGCGVKQCSDWRTWKRVIVICQYKPPGNFIGQYIYNSGATCSACPSGTSCESSSGLCA